MTRNLSANKLRHRARRHSSHLLYAILSALSQDQALLVSACVSSGLFILLEASLHLYMCAFMSGAPQFLWTALGQAESAPQVPS